MAEIALDAVIVSTGHGRGVGGIGAALQPAFGEVAALTNVHGVGPADGPGRVLTSHSHTRPEEKIAGRLGHHGTLPVKTRLDGRIVARVAIQAAVRGLKCHLVRLGAGHANLGVLLHRDRIPGVERVAAEQGKDQDQGRKPLELLCARHCITPLFGKSRGRASSGDTGPASLD